MANILEHKEFKNITISDEGKEMVMQLYTMIFNACNRSIVDVSDLFFSDFEEHNNFHFDIIGQLIADVTVESVIDPTNVVPFRK